MFSTSFEQIVFCNFCHDGPAAGWIEVEQDGEIAGRAICTLCAKERGLELNTEVSHDN